MDWANHIRRWTIRSIHGAVLAAGLLGFANVTTAQTPNPSANSVPKNFNKSLSFNLPIRMDPDFRASLSEVRLYVKGPGQPWKLQEQASPLAKEFQCRVPQDGEYWYTLVTVDRAGKANPPDVNLEAPSQRVIVDTAPPVLQVQADNTGGTMIVRCTVLDANPDHAMLRAVCRTDGGEVPLEIVPNQPGCFLVRNPEMARFPVIVTAVDLAKNVTTKEVSLRDLVGSTVSMLPAPVKTAQDIALPGAYPDFRGQGPAPLQPTEAPAPRIEPAPVTRNEGPGIVNRMDLPTPPIPSPVTKTSATNIDLPAKFPTPPTETGPRGSAPHQLINTTQASLEYRIDQVGPSGVGKVEVYMTPDNGQTWHRLNEDNDKRSPADINLPGDGIYGIRIVVANGNGFGGKTPIRGDAPQCTIEVDTTSPFVQLRSTEVLPSSGHVEIRWNATDRNLGSEPVTLSYRTRPDGPWQVIARNLKNDGVHRWVFPRDAGGQFFFKVEVADQAGNVAHDVSRQPVVIDMSEPRATVVGVSGATPRPALGGR